MNSPASSYEQWPGLAAYYLEDSYVLGIRLDGDALVFQLSVVLTKDHPEYDPPAANERDCFRFGALSFPRPSFIAFVGTGPFVPATDAEGSIDFGHVDALHLIGGRYRIDGDWGTIEVESEPPTISLQPLGLV